MWAVLLFRMAAKDHVDPKLRYLEVAAGYRVCQEKENGCNTPAARGASCLADSCLEGSSRDRKMAQPEATAGYHMEDIRETTREKENFDEVEEGRLTKLASERNAGRSRKTIPDII
jgi:hypothetical protein